MNNKKLFIEVEYVDYSPVVNDRLYRLARNGGEILPGLKVVNIVDEVTKNLQKQSTNVNNAHIPQKSHKNDWVEMDGKETNSMPSFTI